MKFGYALTLCAALGLASSPAAADTIYNFSGACSNVFLVSNCNTIGLQHGDAVSGTLTAKTGFETDFLLTGNEVTNFTFEFGSVNIDSSTHSAVGAYGVKPLTLELFFLVGGMAFVGPGADAVTLTFLGHDAWKVKSGDGITWPGAGGHGGYNVSANVPEPATLALLGFGLAGLAFRAGRRK